MNKKPYLKTSMQRVEKLMVVSEDGEILSEEVDVKKFSHTVNSKEEFFLIYSSIFSVFYNLNGVEIKLFARLLEMFNVTYFAITKPLKVKIAEKIGCAPRSLDNAIKRLIDVGLIYRDEKTVYQINPRYAWKGHTKDREFNLRVFLTKCLEC